MAKFCWEGNAGPPIIIKNIHGYYTHPKKGVRTYRLIYREKLIEVVVARNKKDGYLKILTFNPPPDGKSNYSRSTSLRRYEELKGIPND